MSLLDSYASSARFPSIGARVAGRVVRDAVEMQQRSFDQDGGPGELLWWEDGNPRMQLVVTVDTGVTDPTDPDDDGERAIYIKGQMLSETKKAIRRARSKWIREGDSFAVTLVGEEPLPKGKRGFPKKLYEVEYEKGSGHDDLPAMEAKPEPKPAGLERLATQHDRNDAARATVRQPAQDEEPPF